MGIIALLVHREPKEFVEQEMCFRPTMIVDPTKTSHRLILSLFISHRKFVLFFD